MICLWFRCYKCNSRWTPCTKLDKRILIARFMGPIWGPSGADRTQVGPMLAPWTLLSGESSFGKMGNDIAVIPIDKCSRRSCLRFIVTLWSMGGGYRTLNHIISLLIATKVVLPWLNGILNDHVQQQAHILTSAVLMRDFLLNEFFMHLIICRNMPRW